MTDGPFTDSPYAAHYKGNQLDRANERHKRIIAANRADIEGRRVLDLAAHDGRWTWAALEAGAAYVDAVEWRAELVKAAQRALASFPAERWRFSQGDIYDYLERAEPRFDTILCLGIFYHIYDHVRLLRAMAKLKPAAIVLDGALMTSEQPLVSFRVEPTDNKLNAVPGADNRAEELSGTASRGLLARWAALEDFDLRYVPWVKNEVAAPEAVRDYLDVKGADRARFTCVLRRRG